MTIQDNINSNKDGTMNEAKYKEYVKELIDRGFKKVEVENLKRQDQIKFVLNEDGKIFFRTGGWVLNAKLDSEDIDEDYILIKSHADTKFRNYTISPNDIVEVWSLSKFDQPNALPIYKKPDPDLPYKLYITDENNNEILIYSSAKKENYKKAQKTEKYKFAQIKKKVRFRDE